MDEVVMPGGRKRPVVAALLGLFVQGAGHVYARRPAQAFLLAALLPLIPLAAIYGEIHRTFAGAVALAVLVVLLIVGSAGHAAYMCRRTSDAPPASRAWAWLPYVGVLALMVMWWQVGPMLAGRVVATLCIRAQRITTESMAPTLAKGDLLIVDACQPGAPPNGSLVLFTMPNNPHGTMIKRVAASGGETMQLTATSLFVGGRVRSDFGETLAGQEYGPVSVPADAIFVLGDNLPQSTDSRHFGPVPHALIKGRPLYILAAVHGNSGQSLR